MKLEAYCWVFSQQLTIITEESHKPAAKMPWVPFLWLGFAPCFFWMQ